MSERLKRLGRHKGLSDILTEIMESREDKSLEFITIVTKKTCRGLQVYKDWGDFSRDCGSVNKVVYFSYWITYNIRVD